MKKVSEFIVKRKLYILSFMVLLTIICAFLVPSVKVNQDMTKYLPDDSPMKKGLEVMEAEFPNNKIDGKIRIMFENLPKEKLPEITGKIKSTENVTKVDYDETEKYNKDNYTLIEVSCKYSFGTSEEKALEKELAKSLKEYKPVIAHQLAIISDIPPLVYIVAILVLVIILFVMCSSYTEPILFLLTIGMAILINTGTNIFFPSVSQTTYTLSAILQLALSMDYSIILMNRFRQCKESGESSENAMASAFRAALPSIIGSGMTTVIGLIMLVFMRFKIGLDLGRVMAKGVALSMICVLTVLPALILIFDKVIDKTKKKEPKIPTSLLAKLGYKSKNVIAFVFAILFVGTMLLQNITQITFSQPKKMDIENVFPSSNQLVIIYKNEDENKVSALIPHFEENENVNIILSYGSTVGKPLNSTEMYGALSSFAGNNPMLSPDVIKLLYYTKENGNNLPKLTLDKFILFLADDLMTNDAFSSMFNEEIKAQVNALKPFTNKESLLKPMSADEISQFLGIPKPTVQMIFNLSGGGNPVSKMSPHEVLTFITDVMLKNPEMSKGFDEATKNQLTTVKLFSDMVIAGVEFDANSMWGILKSLSNDITKEQTELLYLYYGSIKLANPDFKMSIEEMLDFLTGDFSKDPRFAGFIDDKTLDSINESKKGLEEAMKGLKSSSHSIMLLDTKFKEESPETTDFIKDMDAKLSANTTYDYYIMGNSAMNVEMEDNFKKDLMLITLLTAFAIFAVVAFTFRSVSIPLILVLLVQCGVFITVTFSGIIGHSVYYLSLLVVQCILMGATIDYAIVFTNYYIENRKKLDIKDALIVSFKESIHTILTSGLILIFITGIIGISPADPAITDICQALSVGTLSAVLLILLVLPGLLATFDKFITKRRKSENKPDNPEFNEDENN